MSEYEAGLERQRRNRERIDAEKARQEFIREKEERESKERARNRYAVIDYLVKKERDELDKKSWFGKAILKLKGQDFYKLRNQIYNRVEERVSKMTAEQIDYFVENEIEIGGRKK